MHGSIAESSLHSTSGASLVPQSVIRGECCTFGSLSQAGAPIGVAPIGQERSDCVDGREIWVLAEAPVWMGDIRESGAGIKPIATATCHRQQPGCQILDVSTEVLDLTRGRVVRVHLI